MIICKRASKLHARDFNRRMGKCGFGMLLEMIIFQVLFVLRQSEQASTGVVPSEFDCSEGPLIEH